jgi:hypothetical protein
MSLGENGGVIRAKVSGPATALLVTGILGIVVQVLGLIANLAGLGLGAAQMQQQGALQPQGAPFNPAYVAMFQGTAAIVAAIIGSVVGIIIIVGATKMKNLQAYGLALASSILAMIPCVSPCCLLGLPFGIWAVVVLSNPEVKQAFRS